MFSLFSRKDQLLELEKFEQSLQAIDVILGGKDKLDLQLLMSSLYIGGIDRMGSRSEDSKDVEKILE